MPLHLVYTKREGGPTKWAIKFEFAMRKWNKNDVIAVTLLLEATIYACFINANYASQVPVAQVFTVYIIC